VFEDHAVKKYPGLMKMITGTTMPTVIGKSFFEEQGKDHGGDSVLLGKGKI